MVYKHERITVKSSLIKNTFQTQDLKGAFIGLYLYEHIRQLVKHVKVGQLTDLLC